MNQGITELERSQKTQIQYKGCIEMGLLRLEKKAVTGSDNFSLTENQTPVVSILSLLPSTPGIQSFYH